jgi:hypothetical protein
MSTRKGMRRLVRFAAIATPVFMSVVFSAITYNDSALRRWMTEAGTFGRVSLYDIFGFAYGMMFVVLFLAILVKFWDAIQQFVHPQRKPHVLIELCNAYLIGILLSIVYIFGFSILSHYYRLDKWLANPHFG